LRSLLAIRRRFIGSRVLLVGSWGRQSQSGRRGGQDGAAGEHPEEIGRGPGRRDRGGGECGRDAEAEEQRVAPPQEALGGHGGRHRFGVLGLLVRFDDADFGVEHLGVLEGEQVQVGAVGDDDGRGDAGPDVGEADAVIRGELEDVVGDERPLAVDVDPFGDVGEGDALARVGRGDGLVEHGRAGLAEQAPVRGVDAVVREGGLAAGQREGDAQGERAVDRQGVQERRGGLRLDPPVPLHEGRVVGEAARAHPCAGDLAGREGLAFAAHDRQGPVVDADPAAGAEFAADAPDELGVAVLADLVVEPDPFADRLGAEHHQGRAGGDDVDLGVDDRFEVGGGRERARFGGDEGLVLEERPDLPFEAARVGPVVGVEPGDEVAVGRGDGPVARLVSAAVLRLHEDGDARVDLGDRAQDVGVFGA
jgi:hypothetical protein